MRRASGWAFLKKKGARVRRTICISIWLLCLGLPNASGQQPTAKKNTPSTVIHQEATPTSSASPNTQLVSTVTPTTGPTITLACPATEKAQGSKCSWVEAVAAIAWPLVSVIALVVLVLNRNIHRALTRLLRRVN